MKNWKEVSKKNTRADRGGRQKITGIHCSVSENGKGGRRDCRSGK